jgi:predicted nucleic acid-binding protein
LNIVFDTEALLAFYLGEPRGREVEKYLAKVMEGKLKGYLNILTLSELYYILYRNSPALAEEKEQNLRSYGLEIVPIDDDSLWKEAAKMKGKHALSLADAFAAATAKIKKASLLAGRDKEFQSLDIQIERID